MFIFNIILAGASKPVVKEKTPFDEPINLTAEPVKGKRLFHITGHSYTRAIMYPQHLSFLSFIIIIFI